MTRQRVRAVHVVARARKGLSEEDYRLRLSVLGVDSCKEFTRDQFLTFLAELRRLPDVPSWAGRARRA